MQRRDLALAGRGGLAAEISRDEMRNDPDAACFCAYFVARSNVRRAFSLTGKDNSMDHVAGMLLDRLGPSADWWMVARCYPARSVVARLTDAQKGAMLGRWSQQMRRAANVLAALDRHHPVNRNTMTVDRGADSTTWNLGAQAFNRARDGWLTLLHDAETTAILDAYCPPKAMRLMAADFVAWQRRHGDPIPADVTVAPRLPAVWEVAEGARCTRADVISACTAVGLDAERTGWTGPRPPRDRGPFRPTPELVHGIVIEDPLLAATLRRSGVFSGKDLRPETIELLEQLDSTTASPPRLGP